MNKNNPDGTQWYFDRDDVDKARYETKFECCDRWLGSEDRLESDYIRLLRDKTTFSYLHFSIDGVKCRLYAYQDMMLNDDHDRIYFRAANQIGKSLLLDIKAAINLLLDHGHSHNEAIVSKSLPQSTFQMRRIKGILNSMPELDWDEIKGETDSMGVISVDIKDEHGKKKYTNHLICAPCTEGVLGYDLHELNLDEYEFWDVDISYFYNQLAQPRTYATKGRICIFSNPNGSTNYGSVLENQLTKDGNHRWHVYVFNYLDKPGNTIAEYEQLRHELPRQVFESTVAAIRSISDRNYFTQEEIDSSYDPMESELKMVGQQPFFALDVGAKHDQCILVGGYVTEDPNTQKFRHVHIPIIQEYPIGYPLARVIGSNVDDGDGWHHVKSVKEYLIEWSANGINPIFGVDVTGNSGIQPLLQASGIYPVDITLSGPVKSGMYQRFKYFMEKHLLHRIKNTAFEYQCSHLEVRKSQRGYLMIHHEKEDDLDDVCDAVAMLIHLADSPVEVIPSLTLV